MSIPQVHLVTVSKQGERCKDIIDKPKKNHEIKWNAQDEFSFSQIKKAILEAPVLSSLDYSKLFNIFSFT